MSSEKRGLLEFRGERHGMCYERVHRQNSDKGWQCRISMQFSSGLFPVGEQIAARLV